MKKVLLFLLLLAPTLAWGQCSGVFPNNTVCGNISGVSNTPRAVTASSFVTSSAAIKNPVDLATTTNITLSGEQTIDGVLTSNSRVLVKDQSIASQNGIYQSSSGAWSRTSDFTTSGQVVEGTSIFVNQGVLNAYSFWYVTTTNPISIGSTAINFGSLRTIAVDGALPASTFGALFTVTSTASNNSIAGMVLQNSAPSTANFPTGVTGYCKQDPASTGNSCFGIFGKADLYANGVAANEFNSFNYSGHDASTNLPPDESIGTTQYLPITLQLGAGGTNPSSIALQIAKEGSTPQTYHTGIYIRPDAVTDYGLFIDGDSTTASQNRTAAVIQNYGNGFALQLKTVGPSQSNNAVVDVEDASSNGVFSIRQNGNIYSGAVGVANGALIFNGSTSGTVTQTTQNVAGTATVTWGTSSGTPAVTASSPLAITTATGNITCTTCGVTTSGLNQFASTTSSQLAGVISDETGSGKLVFGTSPSLTTPSLGVATATSINGVTIPSATDTVALLGTAQKFTALKTFGAGDNTAAILVAGSTEGIRFIPNSTTGNSRIEGVDNTGTLSYQPLTVGGSTIALSTSGTNQFIIDANNNLAFGTGALSTTATNGFPFLPSSAGKPTGVPAGSYTGLVPFMIDSTNHKLCIYIGGWLCSAAFS